MSSPPHDPRENPTVEAVPCCAHAISIGHVLGKMVRVFAMDGQVVPSIECVADANGYASATLYVEDGSYNTEDGEPICPQIYIHKDDVALYGYYMQMHLHRRDN